MNQILRPKFLPLLVLLFSTLGFLLRLQTFGNGPDAEGLYAPQPTAWWLLTLVTLAMMAVLILTVLRLKVNGGFDKHFPPSKLATFGCCFALVGLIGSALSLSQYQDTLSFLTCVAGLIASAAMGVIAFARYRGIPPYFLCHPAVCVYLGLRIFIMGKQWGNESQIGLFLFPLLALVFVMLASYHLATFDVDLGQRKPSIFWSMGGAYLCLVSLADRTDPLLYAGLAVWLLTNHCNLHPLREKKPQLEELEEPKESTPPTE